MNFNHDTGAVESLLTIDTTIASPSNGATNTLVLVGTGSLIVPVGTTAQRPTNTVGMIRFNSTTGFFETNNGSAWNDVATGTGVTSVNVTGSTGLTVGGAPITSTGTITLTLNNSLQSLASLATTGIVTQTAVGTIASRTITGTAGNITVTNGDGVSGNPTINLPNTGSAVTAQFVKITTDAQGRTTGTTAVVASDITSLVDATYVNVSGDSMSSGANITLSGGGEILGLPSIPTTAGSAASRAYVDNIIQGVDPKYSVRVATTTAGTLASSFVNGATIDGVTLSTGDRILVKNQSSAFENGIRVVAASGAPTRATDMDNWLEVPGAYTSVEEGTTQADTVWLCTSNAGGTLDTTPITWTQMFGVGTYTAGSGLSLSGNQFSLISPVSVSTGGTGVTTAPSNGQVLIGNGSGYTLSTLTQGTGITIANSSGSITITNAGVTSVAGTANQITTSAATGAITLSLPNTLTAPGSVTVTTNLTVGGLTANSMIYSGTGGLITSSAATNGQLLIGSTGAAPVTATLTAGTGVSIANAAGSITINNTGVTSVNASGGTTGLSFSGGPVTTTGTLTLAGTLNPANGGTGLTSLGTSNQVFGVNNAGSAGEYKTVSAGTGMSVVHTANTITLNNTGVTSVGLTAPSIFTVAGSPVTTTGTLALSLATQANNVVFAGPTTGGPLVPTFRTLALSDLTVNALRLYTETPSTPTAPIASGNNSVALGSGSSATAANSFALGTGASAYLQGSVATSAGSFATLGDSQTLKASVRGITTTAAITELFLDGSAARMVLPNNSSWTFCLLVAARRTDAIGGAAGYKIEGVIRKDASNASTAAVGTFAKTILGETNAAWDITVDVDTTNGSLRVRATGEAAKTIRWTGVADIVQVTN